VKLQTVSLSVVLVRLRILVGPGKEVLFLGQEDLPIALEVEVTDMPAEGDDLQATIDDLSDTFATLKYEIADGKDVVAMDAVA
jgi:hypothetical protein